jgi:hypothetical protein
LERLYFRFQFSFVLFAAINGWTPTYFFWRRHTQFLLPGTLYFSLLSFNECSLFLVLHLCNILDFQYWISAMHHVIIHIFLHFKRELSCFH